MEKFNKIPTRGMTGDEIIGYTEIRLLGNWQLFLCFPEVEVVDGFAVKQFVKPIYTDEYDGEEDE